MINDEPVANMGVLASAMASAFPAYREQVDELVADVAKNGGIIEYGLISNVFRWNILESAVGGGDSMLIRSCFDFIERLLGSPDPNVRDPTMIRVVPYMLQDSRWSTVTRQYAGRLLAEALDRDTGDQAWR